MDISLDAEVARALASLCQAMAQGTRSEEAYELSGSIIEGVNAAEYSAWEWRWQCFVALSDKAGKDRGHLVEMERAMMRRVATSSPKNYQLWNHRRKLAAYCVECMGKDVSGVLATELEFTTACLEVDAKNYHAWGHRQAMLRAFAGSEDLVGEFAFVAGMLERDVMNNSAWSQRAFLMELLATPAFQATVVRTWEQEFDETTTWIERWVENEASWAYLFHVLRSLRVADVGQSRAVGAAYAAFLARMLNAHPTSIEAGGAALLYYKQLRERETDEAKRRMFSATMHKIRERLVGLDARRAHRWDVNF